MQINPYVSPLPPVSIEKKEGTKNPAEAGFGEFLQQALGTVNSQQHEADRAAQGLLSGEVEDIHQVMIASEKANLSLQLATQVTNKLVEAYREIQRMQV